MNKTELFDDILCKVSSCTGIDRIHILKSKTEESTDARSILVQVLSKYLSDVQIASLLHITARGVNYLRSTFLARSRKWFVRSNYEAVMKELRSG